MRTLESLDEISDGKIYDIRDMVKADAGGCDGCSACCEGVGDLVELTPFDVYEISKCTGSAFTDLLGDKISLFDHKKVQLPHLKMHTESDKCSFLDSEGRCNIHAHRPNICRLFPLGRVYQKDDFKYFLQVNACTKQKLGKVKVKKWIGIANYEVNKAFILTWHHFIKALQFRLKFIKDSAEIDEINAYLHESFFNMTTEDTDFYSVFDARIAEAKDKLGIL